MVSKIFDICVLSIFISLTFICASDILQVDDISYTVFNDAFMRYERADIVDPVNNTALCTDDFNCTYGFCEGEKDKKVCKCFNGISGDFCQIIDDCESKTLDCGNDPNIKCSYAGGSYGQAYCACSDKNLKFDYDTKTCIDCRCGEYALGCMIRDRIKECVCGYRTGERDGKCVECECTSNYIGCKFNGTRKHCICEAGYSDLFNECKECDCGENAIDCGYHRGGQCRCKPGFAEYNSKCQEICNDTHTCQNGGKCINQVCNCKLNTYGSFCESIRDCQSWGDCGTHESVLCTYDPNTTKTTCGCKDKKLAFDNEKKLCRECDCGPNGDCSFWYGKKCKCHEGYAEFDGTCKPCECKGGVCSFSSEGHRICRCVDFSHTDVDGECLECNCGRGGVCAYNGTQKVCFCDSSYIAYNGRCKYCNCGSSGSCSISSFGSTVCDCFPGFSESSGVCFACECGKGVNCTFFPAEKRCTCPEYYEDKGGICVGIKDCKNPNTCPVTTKCVQLEVGYKCICAEGFRPMYDMYTDLQDPMQYGCREICLPGDCNAGKCNITGSTYECICDEGYAGKHCRVKIVAISGRSDLIVGFSVAMMIIGVLLLALGYIVYRYRMNQKSEAGSATQQNLRPF